MRKVVLLAALFSPLALADAISVAAHSVLRLPNKASVVHLQRLEVADSATLGKTAGKDAAADKPTYVSLLGLERAQAYAQELLAEAHAALGRSGLPDTRALAALADMVVRRSH